MRHAQAVLASRSRVTVSLGVPVSSFGRSCMTSPTPFDLGPAHIVGIGGIGMSGIADVMITMGYQVQGSDIRESDNIQRLRERGAARS